jgi:peptidoglycan L-alanyl-D-glutamate endopeptidase CwlK
MSQPLLKADILFFQRLLRADGLYAKPLDGIWGRFTEQAAVEFERRSDRLRDEFDSFDARSETAIRTLGLRTQREARRCMRRLLDHDVNAKIISGTRSYAEQNRLFRQGRYGNPGRVVTRARGGRSSHNFGIAWDIGIFTADGDYSKRARDYVDAARFCKSPELEWGGDWPSFPDPPHYQLAIGLELTVLRQRFERGTADFRAAELT